MNCFFSFRILTFVKVYKIFIPFLAISPSICSRLHLPCFITSLSQGSPKPIPKNAALCSSKGHVKCHTIKSTNLNTFWNKDKAQRVESQGVGTNYIKTSNRIIYNKFIENTTRLVNLYSVVCSYIRYSSLCRVSPIV